MKQRIISAVVLLAIFIPILLIGKIPYAILMTVLAWMGLYEILNLRKTKKDFPPIMKFLSYLLVGLFVITNYNSANTFTYRDLSFYIDYRLMTILIFAYVMPIVFTNDNKKYNFNDALFLIGATLFIGFSFNLLIAIRNISLEYIIYIFLNLNHY